MDCTDGKNILLADRPEEWVAVVDRLMEQPEEIRQLGLNGRKHAMEHFELNEITSRLVAFYKELRRG